MRLTREYLEETRKMRLNLQEMDGEIKELKNRAMYKPAALFSEKVQASRKVDAMESKIVSYAGLESVYTDMYNEWLERYGIIIDGIRNIPYKEQLVIIWYYLEAETVPSACSKKYISRSTFFRLQRSALAHIAELKENAIKSSLAVI